MGFEDEVCRFRREARAREHQRTDQECDRRAHRAVGYAGDRSRDQRHYPPRQLYAVLSLPNFRLPRSWTLSLCAGARRTTPAGSAAGADFFLADCCSQIRGDDGARASGADADVGGRRRGEVQGRRLSAGLLRGAAGGPPALTQLLPTRAREALMMAGAGGAMRATGRRATAIRFRQFGEGGSYGFAR